ANRRRPSAVQAGRASAIVPPAICAKTNGTFMPSIYRLRGMLPYLLAMFMNAFVDLGHKIVIQNTIFKIYDGHLQVMLTAIVNGLILLPYILLFSPAGFVSDRFAKQNVMR